MDILSDNKKNYLTDIIAIVTKRNAYIDSLKTKDYTTSIEYELTIKVKNIEELKAIIRDLENLTFIIEVRRGK